MVIIYSTNTCAYCGMAKEYFEKEGIEFIEKNVQEDHAAAKEMVEKTHQLGVPVIDINGTIVIGFDREAINKALEK
ncbi:MAG: glutaredoxin [uncultured bacterium]|uniref:Glutaredoxin-like protein, YruB-family n=1 Tax=Candidatus Wolfebacteria bacterium GW2011_GWE2_44_13 TaxID=1619017 RepID=A0A0G1HAH6_9BACT|nr:MAG: glutaredoxin [uncultured bacterium]KKT43553.1 MAG: Glutaredoxin-like protein, YruB-family [Candidatus Wolfebacteria bacterium GW2011_GWE2_44_13]